MLIKDRLSLLVGKIQLKLWARVFLGVSWTVLWWTGKKTKKIFFRYAPGIYGYLHRRRWTIVLVAIVFALWHWQQWKPWIKHLDYSWIPSITAGQMFFLAGGALALMAIRALFQTAIINLQVLPSRMQILRPPDAIRAGVAPTATTGQAFTYDEDRQAQIEEIQKLYADGILKEDMPLEEVIEKAFGVEAEG